MTTSLNQPNRIKPQIPFLTVLRLWAVKVCQQGLKFVRTSAKMLGLAVGCRMGLNDQNTPGLAPHPKPIKPDRVGSFSAFLGWFDPVRTRTQGGKTCFSLLYSCFSRTHEPDLGLSSLYRRKSGVLGRSFPYSEAQIWN